MLRHHPALIGIALDPQTWVPVVELLDGLERTDRAIAREQLERIVAESDKQRFAFDGTLDRIRANQGHSVPIDLQLEPAEPPAILFHGTSVRNLDSSRKQGLRSESRHAVHLSADVETAANVGCRRGEYVVLEVDAGRLHADGAVFTLSGNGVWLVERVPPEFLRGL